MENNPILIVDFDRTYLKNDFFAEKFFAKVLQNPLYLFKYWIDSSKGLVKLKEELLMDFNPTYSIKFLVNPLVDNYIRENRTKYSKVVLISASPDFFVKRLLKDSSIFDEVHGSTDVNLKGIKKLAFINKTYGLNFDYLGDHYSDIPIFKSARKGLMVKNNKINIYV